MNKDLTRNLAWGGGIIALALAATLARHLGYIDQEATQRIVLGAVGLMVAAQGNRIPKSFAPSAWARKAKRVAGWSMAVSSLVYAGAFAFAPMDVALPLGCGAVIAGLVVTFGHCLSLRRMATPA